MIKIDIDDLIKRKLDEHVEKAVTQKLETMGLLRFIRDTIKHEFRHSKVTERVRSNTSTIARLKEKIERLGK